MARKTALFPKEINGIGIVQSELSLRSPFPRQLRGTQPSQIGRRPPSFEKVMAPGDGLAQEGIEPLHFSGMGAVF